MTKNRLAETVSPYLLQHSGNPVHWQPWDATALAEAREKERPILLSIGYSACHWCHVMARESFEDPATAALMNDLFVNIKVDREERPDLDTIYQSALAQIDGQRGWPLTLFLTPDAKPYGGGTYYPPEPRYGRPAFRDVVKSMAEAYAANPGEAEAKAARLLEGLKSESGGSGQIPETQLTYVANQLLDGLDPVYGGFGRQSKFPHTMALETLWRAWRRTGHGGYREGALLSAEQMCLGGIYDHLGGGFARYAVDEFWAVPHFEKMLCDSALIVDLLTLLWSETRSPLFAQRIEETLDWMLREMRLEGGGFATALSAESAGYDGIEGGEGAFYVWRAKEIDDALGADEAALFKRHYDVSDGGNWPEAPWEGANVLNRSARPPGGDDEIESRLARSRSILLAARDERPRPERDDKVLADWNGLAIAALAKAGSAFGREDWIDAGRAAFDFVSGTLGKGDRLTHSFRSGRLGEMAILDDYANMARAALTLLEATGEQRYLERAIAWVATADEAYWDPAGGYFMTADPSAILRPKSARETSTPSGNGTLLGVLARLHALTAESAYRDRAEDLVAAFSAEVPVHFFALASLLNASELIDKLIQVVVVGEPGDPATGALQRAALEAAAPNRLLAPVAPGVALPQGHPAAGKTLIEGRPAAYLCLGNTCRLPITEPAALREALDETGEQA